jgi:CspA family cold shock protein
MRATVREWSDEEGWGVLDADDASLAPGGIFAHFSSKTATGIAPTPYGRWQSERE